MQMIDVGDSLHVRLQPMHPTLLLVQQQDRVVDADLYLGQVA